MLKRKHYKAFREPTRQSNRRIQKQYRKRGRNRKVHSTVLPEYEHDQRQ